ncbi:MAG: hypothetical protein WCK00_08305 [Deltaproteobacteria bacterium]
MPRLLWEKLSALPKRVLISGGAALALLILLILFLFPGSPRQKPTPKIPPQTATVSPGPGGESFIERPIGPPLPPPPRQVLKPEEETQPTVQSIRLSPPQPTRLDTLKAEAVTAAGADLSRITYTYVWKVNDRIVAEATSNTLNLSTFKKRDLVTVTVTPHDGDKPGFPLASPIIVVYGASPSLDLQAPLKTKKVGDPLELQLVSFHPDSDSVIFSLEAPLASGMTIDSYTGKITWLILPNQKGTLRFGAAVEDTDKTKVTKTFDIAIE